MAFRTGYLPAEGLAAAKFQAASLKSWWAGERARFVGQDTRADALLAIVDRLAGALQVWNKAKAVPGIAAYAESQYADPAYDVAAAFNAMVAEAQETFDWLIAQWNANAVGYLTLNPDGTRAIQTFTPAQLAGLVTRMDALVATID